MRLTSRICLATILFLLTSTSIMAQTFKYAHNGTMLTYQIVSVPDHEAVLVNAPDDCVNVTVPNVVYCNGEAFKIVAICGCKYGKGAFQNCKYLKTVTLPNTIRCIGNNAFDGCSWLKTINLPSKVWLIDDYAFRGCESLSSITLPISLNEIGQAAFKGTRLKEVTIPKSVYKIGDEAFKSEKLVSIKLPQTIGFSSNKLLVISNSDITLSSNAFPPYFRVWSESDFRRNVITSTGYVISLMNDAKISKKAQADYIVPVLCDAGKYDEALYYFPDNEYATFQKAIAKYNEYVAQGNKYMEDRKFEEAKSAYQQAHLIFSDDSYLNRYIDSYLACVEDSIAAEQTRMIETERLRKEAEERARRESEKASVRGIIDRNTQIASKKIQQCQYREAVGLLQQSLDTAKAHDYDYRASELAARIDSIHQIQQLLSDTSKIFEYEFYLPDQYEAINRFLALEIKNFMVDRDKRMTRNNMTLTFFTSDQAGSFQLVESSKALKKLCIHLLETGKLPPLIIDGHDLKAKASFNYSFEYASGKVKVRRRNGYQSVNVRFDMSAQLESSLRRNFSNGLTGLPNSCDGDYKFAVKSIDINGQMGHTIELTSCSFLNGPQNAWRSLLIPFWGDKYVKGGILKDFPVWWFGTLVCYSTIGYGILGLVNENNYLTSTSFSIKNRETCITMIALGGAVWLADVISVWVKGAKNKKANKEQLGRISFTYDAIYDAPELIYSLSF